MTEPRILVFGYHLIGTVCLDELIVESRNVIGVVTHEVDPGENTWFPSVEAVAERHHIPVKTPKSPKEDAFIAWVRSLRPDVIFSFYYRNIIPKTILDLPQFGAYNLHGSLLPRYRGRCPMNWVLINGERETGITLHVMTPQADAGDIVDQDRFSIGPEDTAKDLFEKAARSAPVLLRRVLPLILSGNAPRRPQDHSKATVFGGRRPEDGRIDWTWPAERISNLVRAVAPPYPGALSEAAGRTFYVWRGKPVPASATGFDAGEIVSSVGKGLVIACGPDGRERFEILNCRWGNMPTDWSGEEARAALEREGVRRLQHSSESKCEMKGEAK